MSGRVKDYEELRDEAYKQDWDRLQGNYNENAGADQVYTYEPYYSGESGNAPQAPAQVSEPLIPGAEADHYLADPLNVQRLRLRYEFDPSFNDPDFTRENIDDIWNYYKGKNGNKPIGEWERLRNDDPFYPLLTQFPNRNPTQPAQAEEAAPYQPEAGRAFFNDLERGSYEQLDTAGKIVSYFSPTMKFADNPGSVEAAQTGTNVTMGAMSGAGVGKMIGAGVGTFIFPGVGTAAGGAVGAGVGAAVGAGAAFYKDVTGKPVPGYDQVMGLMNKGGEVAEQAIGYGWQAGARLYEAGKRGWSDPTMGLLETLGEIGNEARAIAQDSGEMWNASKYAWDLGATPFHKIGINDALYDIAALAGYTWDWARGKPDDGTRWQFTGPNETYRWNEGLGGTRELDPETRGVTGMQNLIAMRREMRERGFTDKEIEEIQGALVTQTGGISGVMSDMVGQMILDPVNFANTISQGALAKLADFTDNAALKQAAAANKGSILVDAAPMILDDVMSAFTGENKTGGPTQIFDTYKNILRTMDADALSPWQRRIANITDDGVLSEFAKRDYSGRAGWIKRGFDLTPESKVIGIEGTAANILRTILADTEPENIRHVLNQIAGNEPADPNSPFASFMNSAEVRTIRNDLKEVLADERSLAALTEYEITTGQRHALESIAEAMGVRPAEVLDLYQGKRKAFDRRIADVAAKSGTGTVGTIPFDPANPGEGTAAVHQTLDHFSGDQALPFNKETLRYQIAAGLTDKIGNRLIAEWGIKPDPLIYRMSDLIKSSQSLLLLGTSPGYFVNNVINNTVTRAATGVYGFMTPNQIRRQQARMGYIPSRMGENLGEMRGFSPNAGTIQEKIANAKRVKGTLSGIQNVVNQINNAAGLFNKLSNAAETFESDQALAIGTKQYMSRVWNSGAEVPEMPSKLRAAMGEELSERVADAVRSSWNMEEINDALFKGEHVRPNAGTILKDVYTRLFGDDPTQGYEEIFVKTGFLDELQERLRDAEGERGIEAAVEAVMERAKKYNAMRLMNDLAARKDTIRTRVENEGYSAVADAFAELAVARGDYWLDSRRRWSEAYGKIAEDGYSRKAMSALNESIGEGWEEINRLSRQTYQGIVEGLGFNDETGRDYLASIGELNDLLETFNRDKTKLFENAQKLADEADDGKARMGIWKGFHEGSDALYDEYSAKELEVQAKADAAFVRGYTLATGLDGAQLAEQFEYLRSVRKEMIELQKEAHAFTGAMAGDKDYGKIQEYYKDFNVRYSELINKLYGGVEQVGAAIDAAQEQAGKVRTAAVTPSVKRMTPQEAQSADRMIRRAAAEQEMAAARASGYMTREEIRSGFVEAGMDADAVDLTMHLYDATAKAWERNNPGKDFYNEALKIAKIERGGKKPEGLFQEAPSVGSENFKKWFRDSKVVDADGNPRVVYHGSAIEFEAFDKNLLGSNTHAPSAETGFFFTSDKEVAQSYAKSPIDWRPEEINKLRAETERLERVAQRARRNEDWQKFYEAEEIYLEAELYYINWGRYTTEEYVKYVEDAKADLEQLRNDPNTKNDIDAIREAEHEVFINELRLKYSELGKEHSKGFVSEVYLDIQNPLIHDFEGERYRDVSYYELIQQAKEAGHDGVILKNTFDPGSPDGDIMTDIFVVFSPNQAKRTDNRGTWSRRSNNMLRQGERGRIKGQFEVINGAAAIRIMNAGDISTMVHESGHAFRRTLNDTMMTDFATWTGFEDLETFRRLEEAYWNDRKSLTQAEIKRYVEAEEKFARGFEQYLIDAETNIIDAPPKLYGVFEAFRSFLLDIYKAVNAFFTRRDYSKQPEFKIDGETLDIQAEVKGIKLEDIFNQMLDEDYTRSGDYNLMRRYEASGMDWEAAQMKAYQAAMNLFESEAEAKDFIKNLKGDVTIDGVDIAAFPLEMLIYNGIQNGLSFGKKTVPVLDPETAIRTFESGAVTPLASLDGQELTGYTRSAARVEAREAIQARNPTANQRREYYAYLRDPSDSFKFVFLNAEDQAFIKGEAERVRQAEALIKPAPEVTDYPIAERCFALTHGDYEIAARVYYQGETVALLPAAKHGVPTAFTDADGQSVQVLGIDPSDPARYVLYAAGDPEPIRRVKSDGAEGWTPTELADDILRPARHGSVPAPIPEGLAGNEVFQKYISTVMDNFTDAYSVALEGSRRTRMSDVPLDARVELERWLDQDVRQSLGGTKYRANKYAESQRDYAMLNYSKRYGFDRMLSLMFPYQFWMTRSMGTWARRAIDRPEYFQAMAERREVEKQYEEDYLPTRLRGKFKIPLMGFEPWMGGGLYMGFQQFNPLNTFAEPIRQWGERMTAVEREAEDILRSDYEAGKLTQAEFEEAMRHEGGYWEDAYAQAKESSDDDFGLGSLAANYFAPNIFASWALKKKMGQADEIGHLPSTRTGNAIGAAFDDTRLEAVGALGRTILTMPERALRSLYGLEYNEFGNKWGDYALAKQLSQMAADGTIPHALARETMVTKTGEAYEEAIRRQRIENAMKLPGGSAMIGIRNALKGNGDIGAAIASIAGLAGGGKVYPTGEKTAREAYALLNEAYKAKAQGDKDAVSRFYREHPEYSTWKLTFGEEPEDMLRLFYAQRINDAYYGMPKPQQLAVRQALGPDFVMAFIDAETRDHDAIPTDKLAEWAVLLSGNIPNLPSAPRREELDPIAYYTQAATRAVEAHDAERDRLFPGIQAVQDAYFDLPLGKREEYLNAVPRLKRLWDWEDAYKANDPLYAQYAEDKRNYYAEYERAKICAGLSDRTLGVLERLRDREVALPAAVRRELERTYGQYAKAGETFDEFVKRLVEE